jgi:hypothetical protein
MQKLNLLAITAALLLGSVPAAMAADSPAVSESAAQTEGQGVGMKPMVSGMNETQIKKQLLADGYTSIRGLKRHSDHYNASALKDGKSVALRIDATTGEATEKAR